MDEELRGLERIALAENSAEAWNRYASAARRAAIQEEVRYGTIRAAHSEGKYFDILPQCLDVLQGKQGKAREYLLSAGYERRKLGPFVVWRTDPPLWILEMGESFFTGRITDADSIKLGELSHFTDNTLIGTGESENEYGNSVFITGKSSQIKNRIRLNNPVSQVKWGEDGKAYAISIGKKMDVFRFDPHLLLEKKIMLPKFKQHSIEEKIKVRQGHSIYALPYIDSSA